MTCPHGFDSPHCHKTGCESSRTPIRLGDWTAQQLTRPEAPALNPAKHDPAAVDTWRATQALGERDNASGDMTRGRGFIGVREDGRMNPGGDDWPWSPRNRVAIPVKGAVFPGSKEASHLVRGIGEAAAHRAALANDMETVHEALNHAPTVAVASTLAISQRQLKRMVSHAHRRARRNKLTST